MVRFPLVVMGSTLAAVIAAVVSVRIPREGRVDLKPIAASASASGTSSSTAEAPAPRASGRVNAGPPSMLHLDPRRTNRSPFEGPTAPTVLWTFDTGGP